MEVQNFRKPFIHLGCLCITVCNDAGVDMGQLLFIMIAP